MARAGATIINKGNGVIGEVRSAMLSEADFQAQFGAEWILADGRSVAGSKYETLTGNANIPDARGVFLRGKDNARALVPSGDLALGTYEADTFVSHNHGGGNHQHVQEIGFGGGGTTARFSGQAATVLQGSIATAASGVIIGTEGGNENKPKNITVNHFIKIN